MFQVFLWVKVFAYTAINSFLDGDSKLGDFSFVLFQKAQTCTNHFAGIVITT